MGYLYGMKIHCSLKTCRSEKLRTDLKGTKVSAINVDQNNNIWVGTYDGLLGKYTSDYKLLKTYHPSSNGPDEMQQISSFARNQ